MSVVHTRKPKIWWRATLDIYPANWRNCSFSTSTSTSSASNTTVPIYIQHHQPKRRATIQNCISNDEHSDEEQNTQSKEKEQEQEERMAKINISSPAFNKTFRKAIDDFGDEVRQRIEEDDPDAEITDTREGNTRTITGSSSKSSESHKTTKSTSKVKSTGTSNTSGGSEPRANKGMAQQHILSNNGWLSFDPKTPRLYVVAEGEEFDQDLLKAWVQEGFDVRYVPMGNSEKEFRARLEHLGDDMSLGERYAIIAFGDAASVALDAHIILHSWSSKLSAIVAYYPSTIPSPQTKYSQQLHILVHLAEGGETVNVSRQTEVLGLQGKKRTANKRITPGTGAGGLQTGMQYRCHTYKGVNPGFAERDLEEFDGVAESVAFERSLALIRTAFGGVVDQEKPWEIKEESMWGGSGDCVQDAQRITQSFVDETAARKPHVVLGPTMTGGVGKKDILRFYSDYFLQYNKEEYDALKMKIKLLSRTVGTDRIVDEMLLSFTHNAPVDWLLPEIPPTKKKVEIVIVCIVGLRAGKLWCEHMYWDQASVLVQVGLLDPKLSIPEKMKKDVDRLPVVGREAARGILKAMDELEGDEPVGEEEVEQLNRLLKDW